MFRICASSIRWPSPLAAQGFHRHHPRRARWLLWAALAPGCAPDAVPVKPRDTAVLAGEDGPFPAPDAHPAAQGPGGPSTTFTEADLFTPCAYLDGGPEDEDQHNLVVPYSGYLLMPWAPEDGAGGLSFFDVSSPCAPQKVGEGYTPDMRETHALGFVHLADDHPQAGDYTVTNGVLGVVFWDVTDISAPEAIEYLRLPDVFYPDAYARVVLSTFWQYPWLYVAAADNGVFIVDASNPHDPRLVGEYRFDPVLRAGGVWALGNYLVVGSAEQTRTAILDITVPYDPQPVPGGIFEHVDDDGHAVEAYHANVVGNWIFEARKEEGGGFLLYDWSNPLATEYVGQYRTPDGNSGYVFYDEGHVFVGESEMGRVFEMSDPTDISIVGTAVIEGDIDTVTPFGNVAVYSSDDSAEPGKASAVVPWQTIVDNAGPKVLRVEPADGSTDVAPTSRVGISFNEMVDPVSVFAGSVRVFDDDGIPIAGWHSVQEGIVSFTPAAPLPEGAIIHVAVPAGGVMDPNGNRTETDFEATFTILGR